MPKSSITAPSLATGSSHAPKWPLHFKFHLLPFHDTFFLVEVTVIGIANHDGLRITIMHDPQYIQVI
jgi:hypothetical protein